MPIQTYGEQRWSMADNQKFELKVFQRICQETMVRSILEKDCQASIGLGWARLPRLCALTKVS